MTMKRILILITLLITLLVFLTGCEITGKVVEEIEQQMTQGEKDFLELNNALGDQDVSICYSIQTQGIREDCFITLAKDLQDPSICNNLLGISLKDSCKENI